MPSYRTFRNVDPPALVAIWRSRAGQPGLRQPVSVDLLEQFIFGKVYFDYEGLIVAFEEDRPVGFAHAAFGPNETCDRVAMETGIICMLMVRPDCAQEEVAEGLLERCEAYLRRRGAEVLYGGPVPPLCPFYLGLYGGSQLPGVLESDVVARDLYRSHGYRQIDRTHLFRRRLGDFRPPVDRRQIQLRRRMIVQMNVDPPFRSWWEACTAGDFDLTRFQVTRRGDPSVVASVTFRGMEAVNGARPGRAAGLLDLYVASSLRRQGLATFLLSESFRQLARQGVATIEAQASGQNPVGLGLCRKLGMKEVEHGVVFRKDVAPE